MVLAVGCTSLCESLWTSTAAADCANSQRHSQRGTASAGQHLRVSLSAWASARAMRSLQLGWAQTGTAQWNQYNLIDRKRHIHGTDTTVLLKLRHHHTENRHLTCCASRRKRASCLAAVSAAASLHETRRCSISWLRRRTLSRSSALNRLLCAVEAAEADRRALLCFSSSCAGTSGRGPHRDTTAASELSRTRTSTTIKVRKECERKPFHIRQHHDDSTAW